MIVQKIPMHFNYWMFLLWVLVCLYKSSVEASDQYHIQTDEGPERYFRFQTNNGQFRKEKRLQDGTVIGTEAWIDAAGYLRLKDYIADKQGYRILKSKVVYVGQGTEIGDAIKSTKSVPAQAGMLVDGKQGLRNRPNSIASHGSNIYAPVTSTLAPATIPPRTTSTTEQPILGYLSPAEAAKLEPTPYLGFDHYPNELPETSKQREPVANIRPKIQNTYQHSTTRERPAMTLPSIYFEPPRESSRRRIRPIAVLTLKPQPISRDDLNKSSTPKPFEALIRNTATANTGYYYAAKTYPLHVPPEQSLSLDINALEDGLLPPLLPSYQRRGVSEQQNDYAHNYNAPDHNDITVTRNGFRYVLPHQYHEEEQIDDFKKAGSFGYVDPFGIRRVVYYNASPAKGFVHRNRNRYVGLGARPYDEP